VPNFFGHFYSHASYYTLFWDGFVYLCELCVITSTVKLDPVSSLQLTNKTSTSLLLMWNKPDFFKTRFRVRLNYTSICTNVSLVCRLLITVMTSVCREFMKLNHSITNTWKSSERKVALGWVRPVMRWVTIRVYTIFVFDQPPKLTQPGHPSVGRQNKSWYWRWLQPPLEKKWQII